MITFRFKHPYIKLDLEIFPTTRGKSWITKVTPDQEILIENSEGETFEGIVIDLMLKRLNLLSKAFIQIDGSYLDHSIKTHGEFLELLNSFRRNSQKLDIFSIVCVIWICKN